MESIIHSTCEHSTTFEVDEPHEIHPQENLIPKIKYSFKLEAGVVPSKAFD